MWCGRDRLRRRHVFWWEPLYFRDSTSNSHCGHVLWLKFYSLTHPLTFWQKVYKNAHHGQLRTLQSQACASRMELSPKTVFISLVVRVISLLDSGTEAVIQGPTPVSVLAPVGSFVDFTCTVNISELPENTFYHPIRWRKNNAILIRMGQAVSGNTVSLE